MPRLYFGLNKLADFCLACFPPTEKAARKKYSVESNDGKFVYKAEHPDYLPKHDRCVVCRRKLTSIDD